MDDVAGGGIVDVMVDVRGGWLASGGSGVSAGPPTSDTVAVEGDSRSLTTSISGCAGRIGLESRDPNGIPARTAHSTMTNPTSMIGTQIQVRDERAAGGTGAALTGDPSASNRGGDDTAITLVPHRGQNCASDGIAVAHFEQNRASAMDVGVAESVPYRGASQPPCCDGAAATL